MTGHIPRQNGTSSVMMVSDIIHFENLVNHITTIVFTTMKLETIKRLGILFISMMAMMTSCVQGDLYELYEDDSFQIVRNKKNKDVSSNIISAPGFPYFDVSSELFGSTECVLDALNEKLPSGIKKRTIRAAMESVDCSVASFDISKLCAVISNLNSLQSQYTIYAQTLSASDLIVGDIAVTQAPLILMTFNSDGSLRGLESDSGHCFVVDEIVTMRFGTNNYQCLCDDGFLTCKLAREYFQGGVRITYNAR